MIFICEYIFTHTHTHWRWYVLCIMHHEHDWSMSYVEESRKRSWSDWFAMFRNWMLSLIHPLNACTWASSWIFNALNEHVEFERAEVRLRFISAYIPQKFERERWRNWKESKIDSCNHLTKKWSLPEGVLDERFSTFWTQTHFPENQKSWPEALWGLACGSNSEFLNVRASWVSETAARFYHSKFETNPPWLRYLFEAFLV